MLYTVLSNAPVFILVFARCIALILTAPLFSSRAIPRTAIAAFALLASFIMLRTAEDAGFSAAYGQLAVFTLPYLLTLAGEALIGIIMGFYVSIIFSAFSTAGQFFSFQTGLGASEVYDALAQVSNPILGQYLNLMAMLLFLTAGGFQELFLSGLLRSYQSINAASLAASRDVFYRFLLSGLTDLFFDAFMIALPVSGVLFLVSISMGLLTKAAPQMNLLSEGLPLTILVSFFVIAHVLPAMCYFFNDLFTQGLRNVERLFISVSGGI
ncbi:MAG: flagellar biosynthetic protein FliR [Treponemataceae bacterium]|nr:MAG: flagellar biosynthetic protein FliR [Treponemataceae bacterium]